MRSASSPTAAQCTLCGQAFSSTTLAAHAAQCFNAQLTAWLRCEPAARGPKPQMPSIVTQQAHPHARHSPTHSAAPAASSSSTSSSSSRPQAQQRLGRARAPSSPSRTAAAADAVARTSVSAQRTPYGDGGNTPRRDTSSPQHTATVPEATRQRGTRHTPESQHESQSTLARHAATAADTRADGDGAPARAAAHASRRHRGERPMLPMCYLCGNQFGTTSIAIHIPQCYAKQLARWNASDPHTRGQPPRHPDSVDWRGGGRTAAEQMTAQYDEFVASLEPCPHCGRRFLADRLVVHLRSCRPGSPARQPPTRRTRHDADDGGGRDNGAAATVVAAVAAVKGDGGDGAAAARVAHRYNTNRSGSSSSNNGSSKTPPTLSAADTHTQTTAPSPRRQDGDDDDDDVVNNTDTACNNSSMGVRRAPATATATAMRATPVRLCPATNRLPRQPQDEFDADGRSCMQCHTVEYDAAAKFCRECGHALSNVTAAAAATATASAAPPLPPLAPSTPSQRRLSHVRLTSNRANDDHVGGASDAAGQERSDECDNTGDGASTAAPSRQHGCMYCPACDDSVADLTAVYCEECGGALQRRGLSPAHGPHEGDGVGDGACASAAHTLPPPSQATTATMAHSRAPVAVHDASRGTSAVCATATDVADAHCTTSLHTTSNTDDAAVTRVVTAVTGATASSAAPTRPLSTQSRATATVTSVADVDSAMLCSRTDANCTRDAASRESSGNGSATRACGDARTRTSARNGKDNNTTSDGAHDDAGDEVETMARQACPHCQRLFAVDSLQRHERVCARRQQGGRQRPVYNATQHRMPDMHDMVATRASSSSNNVDGGGAGNAAVASAQRANGPRPGRGVEAADNGTSRPPSRVRRDWRAESCAFRAAMRAAREVDSVLRKGGNIKDLPPPAYDAHPEYVPCPHCGRRFAGDVAERHIPRCAQTVNRPRPPPSRRR